ncbi:uncharacterized protein LOC110914536 [Helianthus annuus]|uniref:uncharacterized protein LOC110914536 n=1 Tax=Helianthus annuus TaxID=4232 RepID=UPI000B8F3E68|nr:uncharacterized protein LOC110914536 [Helianthus annuus]
MGDNKSDGVFSPVDRGKPSVSFDNFANRVIDVEGNTWKPRRGTVQMPQTEPRKPNILEELFSSSVQAPVEIVRPETTVSENLEDSANIQGNRSDGGNNSKPMSYVDSVLAAKPVKVNFRSLASPVTYEGCDVVLPRDSVRAVQEKLANTLYGYFLGDRVAYPVVDYFVKNQWKRFGLQKSMMNANGFFFFKFADEAGMLNFLKEGPWIIRSQPMFLHIWSPTYKLEKKEVKKLQVWVKIHDVPIAAYTEDGLSMIATAIGEPKMLDTYTSSMCTDNWGRSSYVRALVEISAENGFKEEIVIAVPELEGEGFSKVILSVEYEWSPLRCAHCKVFGHSDDSCPRQPRRAPKV